MPSRTAVAAAEPPTRKATAKAKPAPRTRVTTAKKAPPSKAPTKTPSKAAGSTKKVTKRARAPMVKATVTPTLRVLTASGRRIDLKARRLVSPQPKDWQEEAWVYFDDVTEVKEPIWYLGNQMAKLDLFVGVLSPVDGSIVDATSELALDADGNPLVPPAVATAALEALQGVRSLDGGQSELLRAIEMNLEVPGECWLAGFAERPPTVENPEGQPADWMVLSIDELEVKGRTYIVKRDESDTKGVRKFDPELDTLIRIWLPHPRWKEQADSLMKGVLPDCRILQAITQQQLAEAYSRLSAGFFTWPTQLNPERQGNVMSDPEDDGSEGDAPKRNPQLAKLIDAVQKPVEQTDHPYGLVPAFIEGDAQFLTPDVLRHISIARPADPTIDSRKEKSIERVARGMNLPVEKVMGHQQTTFANAAQVDADEYEDYLQPREDMLVVLWTNLVMRPIWLDDPSIGEAWADRLVVGADHSALIASPDIEKNANDAWDRNTISDATYRKAKGYTEDDAADEDERRERMGARRGILTADLTKALLETLGDPITVEALPLPEPVDAAPADAAASGTVVHMAETAAARRRRRHRASVGEQLMLIDRELRTRLLVAADAQMKRALERAGNRIRAKATGTAKAAVRNVAPHLVAATLGPSLVADTAGDLFAGAWDDLEASFRAWAGEAGGQASELVSQVTAGFTTAERDALKVRQLSSVDEAWSWFRDRLEGVANEKLFNPAADVVALGESVSAEVAPGLVRQAISRAGGATGLITEDGGAFISLTDGGSRPAGGIGTGELIRDTLRDNGAGVEGYVWVYGPALRKTPFEPHLALDGVEFASFDDDVLANDEGWPEVDFFFPGDHEGCVCDFSPTIIAAADAGVDIAPADDTEE